LPSYHSAADLPAPDEAQKAYSLRLVHRLIERIEQAGGTIPFEDYMHACLYEPGLGYYSAGSAKFGAEGDFVTAPELTPLFGRTLARQAESLFAQGLPPGILEFGAGSGCLCCDLLGELEARGVAWDEYAILEPSPDLRQRQQALFARELPAGVRARIRWLERLPNGFRGLVLGNEVLDAMPLRVLHKRDGWRELGVAFEDGRFRWRELPQSRADAGALAAIQAIDARLGLPEGYRTEVNRQYGPWCRALAGACVQAVVLLIDYGHPQTLYYHPSRTRGWLQCFYRHRVHGDPFVYPGLQDITAFVDFDAFGEAARDAGFELLGLRGQGEFLLANGLLDLADGGDADGDALSRLQRAQQIKTLTLPNEMGERFKVAGLALGGRYTLNGF